MTAIRRWPRGLRFRLMLALLATGAAVFVAAVPAFAPSLSHRLERDRLDALRQLARTARLGLRGLPARDLRPGAPATRALLADLQRRTGGRASLYTPAGESLADTEPAGPDRARDRTDLAFVRGANLPRRGDVREGVRKDQAIVVAGVRRDDGRRLVLVLRKPLEDTRAAQSTVRAALLPAAAAGAVVALILAVALSGGLLRRLRRLRDDARALGEEGLGHEIDVGPSDEVGEVAAALEAMRTRLIADEGARQTFLATASHELRTPLATLQGTLELLREGLDDPHADPQARRDRADAALRQTHRLVALATDLLDLNRLDGTAPVAAEPVELLELTDVAAADLRDALTAAGRRLAIAGTAPVHALADPAATLRIIGILLDNARAYGAGTISVAVARDGAAAVVDVRDEGPGLAPAEAERVFLRFERGSAASAQHGFGLGLALARGLAEAMEGTLVTAPPAPAGARFVLRLPGWDAT